MSTFTDDKKAVPEHVAIILDGNGRWAERKNLPRTMGHKAGCDTLERTVHDAADLGIRFLTAYGFSTENWKRSEEEVSGLMKLFRIYLRRLYTMALENNVAVRVIGDRSRFDKDLADALTDIEKVTAENTRLTFTLALNYGSRDEITRAVRKIARRVSEGEISVSEISEEMITASLDTAGLPDPDLLIRTGSEMRLSNYLLWQSAYTELYVTDVLWPDFSAEDLKDAVEAYGKRNRKFGGVKKS